MKVMLISANTEVLSMHVMPIGLACVAEAAKKAGHDVSMLDLMSHTDIDTILKKAISDFNPRCIGISVRNVDNQNIEAPKFLIEKVKKVITLCKKASDAPIVLGGAGYSLFPQSILKYLNADMGIQGQGETSFVCLLDKLEQGLTDFKIPGLYISDIYGQNSSIPAIHAKNLDSLPLPDIDLLYDSALKAENPCIPVQTRRGCPFNCTYCPNPVIEGRIIRKRSPQNIVKWLSKWAEKGIKDFFFVDSTFNAPYSYAENLTKTIIENNLDIKWRAIIYPNNKIDENLVKLMAKSGCIEANLGFESGSNKVLKSLNKKFSTKEIIDASKLFADYGIKRTGFLMLGGPSETKQTVEKSLIFLDSLKLDDYSITVGIRIYPYTPLAQTALQEKVISKDQDLLYPCFYLNKKLRDWLPKKVKEYQKR